MKATLAILLASCLAVAGCDNDEQARREHQLRKIANQSEQLSLDRVIETFNHLYDFVDLELEPAMAVLDNRRTYDGQDALAMFGRNPAAGDAPYSNHLTITSRNIALKQLDGEREVKPGDRVHYFIQEGDDEFLKTVGMADFEAIEMTVAQVIDDDEILVEERFPPVQTEAAYKIEIWRNVDDRVREIETRLGQYAEYASPPLNWQPTPDEIAIEQALNRLNQWMRQTHQSQSVEPPGLLQTLPEALRTSPRLAPYVTPETLGRVSFAPEEGRLLQQAIWLRNIANWARKDTVGDVNLAAALFDFTVRHIQLETADSRETAHHLARSPWEILLYGHGTAEQRAWIFALLCRQQGLPALILSIPAAEGDGDADAARPQFWCAAIHSGGELYLFDPALGLSIPKADGTGVATLAEAASDPEVLGQLAVDGHSYRWTHEDVQGAVAQMVASPLSLSRRADLLQKELVGQSGFVIAADPRPIAEALAEQPHVSRVALWAWPFEVLDRKLAMATRQGGNADERKRQRLRAALEFRTFALSPHLWKARVLHFRGPARQAETAPDEEIETERVDGHQQAIALYQAARIADRELAAEPSERKRQLLSRTRDDATYWLALLKMDQEDYQIALTSWLPQVVDAVPPSPWLAGARYNSARALEQVGQAEKAIAIYENDESPQQHGNQLRARLLKDGQAVSVTQR